MNHPFQTVLIHPSFRADALRQKRIASLMDGTLDHAFHYAGVRQAELWLHVHQTHAPVTVDPAFETIYRHLARDLAMELAGEAVHVIGLGSGGGEKEAWVLEALKQQGCRIRYTPLDVSPELALLSAEVAENWVDQAILPIVGDLSLLPDLKDWLDGEQQQASRIYTAFGLTPNFAPSILLKGLGGVLRDTDHLLLSANLAPTAHEDEAAYHTACRAIQAQYDNPATRTWLRQVLIDWGIAARLSEPRFELGEMEGIAGFFAWSQWLEDTRLDWDGLDFRAAKGEALRLFFSLRYTEERLAAKLQLQGLSLAGGYLTPCKQEGVWRVGTTP